MIPPQRKAYLDALAEAIHRNLRFLEVVATSPIGLTTDLLSLREAMPVEGASERRDRAAFRDLTGRGANPRPLGIQAQNATLKTIELLDGVAPDGENPLPPEMARAGRQGPASRCGPPGIRRAKGNGLRIGRACT